MKLLLDTCTFLWFIGGDETLSPSARELIVNPGNEVFLSSISCWEIAVKSSLGRLELSEPAEILIPRERDSHGILPLVLDEHSALHVSKLPDFHRDPFDRILICQAHVHGMVLVTPDVQIRRYPVVAVW